MHDPVPLLLSFPLAGRVLLQSEDLATAVHMRDEFWRHGADHFVPCPVLHVPDACLTLAEQAAMQEPLSPSMHQAAYAKRSQEQSYESAASALPCFPEAVAGDGIAGAAGGTAFGAASGTGAVGGIEGSHSICRDVGGGSVTVGWEGAGWLKANPLGVPTEREVYVQTERVGTGVYRLMLTRTAYAVNFYQNPV